jgi:thymidine kinase
MLEVITGCMYSGKSEELIRRLRRCEIAGQKVVAFKSPLDDRYSTDIATHPMEGVATTLKAKGVNDSRDMAQMMGLVWHDPILDALCDEPDQTGPARWVPFEEGNSLPDVVGFDEVQFMTWHFVEFFEELANQGVRVIVAGLDLDAEGKNFGPIGSLLARADKVTKLTAVCVAPTPEGGVCGKTATRSYRIPSESSGEQVQVGAAGVYEARCRACWVRGRAGQ